MSCLFVLPIHAAVAAPARPASDPAPVNTRSLLDLPDFRAYKVDPYLTAAARLQTAGREEAVAVLTDLAGVRDRSEGRRVIILCRMLFTAKPNEPFRRPSLGYPAFVVGPFGFKDRPLALSEWPREPIEVVDGVPFLVVTGYALGGYPEPARDYLNYCVRNCSWNTEVFRPKSAGEKRKALAKLAADPRWGRDFPDEARKALAAQVE